jgi:hypothetical protein
MPPKRYNAMPRLIVPIIGQLLLFAWFRDMTRWISQTQEAWEFFRIGLISSLVLVFTLSVIMRGNPPEKVAAIGLSLLPSFCLVAILKVYVSQFL